MLTFNAKNRKGESPMSCRRFTIRGDGESTSLSVDLAASPVGMEFRANNKPVFPFAVSNDGQPVSALSIDDGILIFRFDSPLAIGEYVDVDIDFYYQGATA